MTVTENRVSTNEVLRKREQSAAIFTRPPNGELNVEAIRLLIAWAEQDQRLIDRFAGWGDWRQGSWNLTISPDAYSASIDYEAAINTVKEQRKNGVCQTAYCMAGQAVMQAGYDMVYAVGDIDTDGGRIALSSDICEKVEFSGTLDREGRPVFVAVGPQESISITAADILGINGTEADMFFEGGNGIEDLKRYANRFCDERGLDVMYPDFEDVAG